MKTFYEIAEMEISVFECEDVITTSGLPGVSDDDDFNGGDIN